MKDNYIVKRGNFGKPAEAEKYYGRVQFADTLDLTQLAHYMASPVSMLLERQQQRRFHWIIVTLARQKANADGS